MAGARKLVVEVVAAKGLMPKDGQGSTNAYCVVGCTSFFSFVKISRFRSSGLRGMQYDCRKYSRLWGFFCWVDISSMEKAHEMVI